MCGLLTWWVDLLRGPEPVSKYENKESNSSGQNSESRRNFAAAAADKVQNMTRAQSDSKNCIYVVRLLATHSSDIKQMLFPCTNQLKGLQEKHCRARIGDISCGLCWGPEQSCCVSGTSSLSKVGTSSHPPPTPHFHWSFSGIVSLHIWT